MRGPGPRIPKPQRRQKSKLGGFTTAIYNRDPYQNVVHILLCVLGKDVEVSSFVENSGIDQLELRIETSAPAILLPELLVREASLRVLVQALEIRMRGSSVQVKKQLLHVLPVVALIARQSEKAFFEDRILAIPKRQCETKVLMVIAY